MSTLDDLRANVIEGEAERVEALTRKALDEGLAAQTILDEGLIVAMSEVGRLYQIGEFYVPEMLVAARAMKMGLELLRPGLAAADVKAVATVVIGTVEGDLHDIGKNLVGIMLEGAGVRVIDLGVNVPPQKFVAAVREHHAQVVALSALLTTTMVKMKDAVQALKEAGLREQVQVIVGGAPVTQDYATQIGADGYASDAAGAVHLVQQLAV